MHNALLVAVRCTTSKAIIHSSCPWLYFPTRLFRHEKDAQAVQAAGRRGLQVQAGCRRTHSTEPSHIRLAKGWVLYHRSLSLSDLKVYEACALVAIIVSNSCYCARCDETYYVRALFVSYVMREGLKITMGITASARSGYPAILEHTACETS